MLRALVLIAIVSACAAATTTTDEVRRGPVYKPGQSILEARLCSCNECVDSACCSGEREAAGHVEPELGMTLAACGRCVRRVWTVRGGDSCESLAGPVCCTGTVSD